MLVAGLRVTLAFGLANGHGPTGHYGSQIDIHFHLTVWCLGWEP